MLILIITCLEVKSIFFLKKKVNSARPSKDTRGLLGEHALVVNTLLCKTHALKKKIFVYNVLVKMSAKGT